MSMENLFMKTKIMETIEKFSETPEAVRMKCVDLHGDLLFRPEDTYVYLMVNFKYTIEPEWKMRQFMFGFHGKLEKLKPTLFNSRSEYYRALAVKLSTGLSEAAEDAKEIKIAILNSRFFKAFGGTYIRDLSGEEALSYIDMKLKA